MEESKDLLLVEVPSEEMVQVTGESPVVRSSKDGEDVVVGRATLDHQVLHNAQFREDIVLQGSQVPGEMWALDGIGCDLEMSYCDGVSDDLEELLPPVLGASWWQEAQSLGPQQKGSINAFLSFDDAHGRDKEGGILGHQAGAASHNVPQLLGQGAVQFWEAPEVGLYAGQVQGAEQVVVVQLAKDVVL